jgi:NRPS condensation-like uncharacterized protein
MDKFVDESRKWYRLDNAAKIYPVVITIKESHVFRVSMTLKEEVNPEILQKAVEMCQNRFPTFYVKMKPGLFWYYFEPNEKKPIVKPEPAQICQPIVLHENNNYFFTIYYYQKRISLEVFHGLCDGTGAMEFLKAICFQYLVLQGHQLSPEGLVRTIGEVPTFSETEDSYLRYYTKEKGKPLPTDKSFKIKGTRLAVYGSSVIKGKIDSRAIYQLAKSKNATVTEFLVALLTYSVIQFNDPTEMAKRPISICIPVNMRRHFPSETIRNFALFFHTIYRFKSKDVTFDEVLQDIKQSFKERLTKDDLQKKLNLNVGIEKKFIVRIMPLFLKKIMMKFGYHFFGSRPTTVTISNLGVVRLPESMKPYVEEVEFNLGSGGIPSVAVATYEDYTILSFSRGYYETDLEYHFFKFLTEQGLEVEIQSNLWEQN